MTDEFGEALPSELAQSLVALRVVDRETDIVASRRLAGGVSSDIWMVETRAGAFCVKRALARLKVAALWEAPIERNRYERLWCETANAIRTAIAPRILAHDDARQMFVMDYLAPDRHKLWKSELAAGRVDPDFAGEVGAALGAIHRATARRADLARIFDTTPLFERLRIDPYLRFTATRHPDLAPRLTGMADDLAARRVGLVHGDVSPKNILIGPSGPVLLDAECAWYGDVAFDPAFCLNHLLLKSVWRRDAHAALRASRRSLWRAYSAAIDWEPVSALEARCAVLLGGLLLARIDGKSPVEYIVEEADKRKVRDLARGFIAGGVDNLEILFTTWEAAWAP